MGLPDGRKVGLQARPHCIGERWHWSRWLSGHGA